MNFGPTSIAFGIFAAGVGFVEAVDRLTPIGPYMVVHSVKVDGGGDVTADRTVRRLAIADWRVTIVPDAPNMDAPSCQTIPGQALNEGWSKYSIDAGERTMPLDAWVGDPGCWGRLPSGTQHHFVTWTPRDGSPPVVWRGTFEKP